MVQSEAPKGAFPSGFTSAFLAKVGPISCEILSPLAIIKP